MALAIRGFAPDSIKKRLRFVTDKYELRDIYATNEAVFNIPIVSGCFMFCRYNTWREVGGFSKHYFMYFEDFDLSLRMGNSSRVAYMPTVKITHLGGQASHKGWRHIAMFMRSALTFFRRNGWKIW